MLLSELGGQRQSAADLQRKLSGTFILVRILQGEPEVMKVADFAEDEVTGYLPERKIAKHLWEDVDVLKVIPESGIYQLEKGIAMVRRLPNRQHKDGACAETVSVVVNGDEMISVFNLSLMGFLYKPQKDQNFEVARQKLEETGVNQRINSRFWLKKEAHKNGLFYNRTRLGSWDMGSFFWSPGAKIFNEELKDLNFHAEQQ